MSKTKRFRSTSRSQTRKRSKQSPMKKTIVLIGAGSAQFGYGTIGDILQSQVLHGSEIVLHDINLATRFCDHIVALHQGDLIAQGNVEQVFTEPKLRDIYGIEMKISDHPAGYPVAMPS